MHTDIITLMNKHSAITNKFTLFYNKKEIPIINFDSSWNDGNGHFCKATNLKIDSGKFAKSECPETERKLILIGTKFGTVILFERFSKAANPIYVCNFPKIFSRSFINMIHAGSSLSQDTISRLLGNNHMDTVESNLGLMIESLFEMFNNKNYNEE